MNKKMLRILAMLMAIFMLIGVAGCRKTADITSGEWISERDYYYYDAGNWVEITDDSYFDNLENDTTDDTVSDSNQGGNSSNNTKPVDSSNYQTLIDYCGNDKFDKTFENVRMQRETIHSDVLEDDWRFRKGYVEKDAYVTYKVDGIAEFFVEYSYGAGDRYGNHIYFYVSKDNKNWTEVKAQDKLYMPFNGDSWERTRAYFGNVKPENKYLKIYIDAEGSTVYNPNINMVQINGLTEEVLSGLGMYNSKFPAKNIYIDSKNGKDTNSGTSEKEPLKSLYAASKKVYSPGSKILLKAGCDFSGSLTIIGNGTSKKPITVTSYGKGDKPVINARGGAAIEAYGEYMTFTGLEITNKAGKSGITIIANKPGATKGIKVTKCDFHDINVNFKNTSYSASGVYLYATGREPAWFDGVTVENNTFNKVARCGVVISSDWTCKVTNQEWGHRNDVEKGEWFGSKNVVIRNNKLNEIGGDGILLFGCDGALVEKNVVANSGLFKNMGEIHWVAIWCHSCTGCVFQYNEVYGNSGKNNGHDLQAFDADIANKDCIFQYNYSHDNEGGFMLFCTNDAKNNAQTTGTIVRYNLSVNDGKDGGMVVDVTSSCYDSQFYNNTIYMGKYKNLRAVNFVNYDGGSNESKNTVFTNNIFYAEPGLDVTFNFARLESATFNNNVFYNVPIPVDTKGRIKVENSITDKPNLVDVGATGNGLEKIAAKYKPKSGFVLTKGIAVKNSGGKDLLGKKVDSKLLGALAK